MKIIGVLLLAQALFVAAQQGSFYNDDENIYELSPSNFDKVIHKSNYTTIVEFYAPWCGYCKQLKGAYTKLGKFIQQNSKYGVNVAAVNCDKDYNKQLCSQHQVTGFPTLKVFRPPKYDAKNSPAKETKHVAEVYAGERGFKSMVNFVTSRIKNYVKKLHLKDSVEAWVNKDKSQRYKVLLVTKASTVSPMYKTLAIDFLTSIKFGFLTTKEALTINVNGNSIELEDDLPAILLFDTEANTVHKYDEKKKTDKIKLSKWLMEKTAAEPIEGELSKKDQKYYSKYRVGKKGKKIVHDEL